MCIIIQWISDILHFAFISHEKYLSQWYPKFLIPERVSSPMASDMRGSTLALILNNYNSSICVCKHNLCENNWIRDESPENLIHPFKPPTYQLPTPLYPHNPPQNFPRKPTTQSQKKNHHFLLPQPNNPIPTHSAILPSNTSPRSSSNSSSIDEAVKRCKHPRTSRALPTYKCNPFPRPPPARARAPTPVFTKAYIGIPIIRRRRRRRADSHRRTHSSAPHSAGRKDEDKSRAQSCARNAEDPGAQRTTQWPKRKKKKRSGAGTFSSALGLGLIGGLLHFVFIIGGGVFFWGVIGKVFLLGCWVFVMRLGDVVSWDGGLMGWDSHGWNFWMQVLFWGRIIIFSGWSYWLL